MAVYLVTWNLNKEPNYAKARADFIKVLDSYTTIRDRNLETVRFVHTQETAEQLAKKLNIPLDKNDTLIVSQMRAGEYFGWLEPQIWEWILPKL